MDVRGKLISGRFLHAPGPDGAEILADALVAVDAAGTITSVTPTADPAYAERRTEARQAGTLAEMAPRTAILPGFVDLHIHAPQYPQLGKALDVPLEVCCIGIPFRSKPAMPISPSRGGATKL